MLWFFPASVHVPCLLLPIPYILFMFLTCVRSGNVEPDAHNRQVIWHFSMEPFAHMPRQKTSKVKH